MKPMARPSVIRISVLTVVLSLVVVCVIEYVLPRVSGDKETREARRLIAQILSAQHLAGRARQGRPALMTPEQLFAAKARLIQMGGDAVDPLVERLEDDDPAVRLWAVDFLTRLGPVATPKLCTVLRTGSPDARVAAASALASLRDDRAFDAIVPLLSHERPDLREIAVHALGAIPHERVVPHLIPLLADPSEKVRGAGAAELGTLADERAVDALIQALSDPSPWVREQAAYALGEIRDTRARPHLLKALQDQDEHVRYAAALVLGSMPDPDLADALIAALSDAYPPVRRAAAYALGKVGDPRAIPPLLKALSDDQPGPPFHSIGSVPSAPVAADAATALGRLHAEAAVQPLIALLRSPIVDNRIAAVTALGDLAKVEGAPALLERMSDMRHEVVLAAARALAKIPRSVPQADVEKAAASDARPVAKLAYKYVLFRWGQTDKLKEILPPPGAEGSISFEAVELLSDTNAPRVIAALLAGVRRGEKGTAAHCADALAKSGDDAVVPDLLQVFEASPPIPVRCALVRTLAAIGSPRAVAAVKKATSDESFAVRREARRALRVHGGR